MVMKMGFQLLDDEKKSATVIKVIGVGGAGGNAINHMIDKGIMGVEFISANTDAQALSSSRAENRIALGSTGLGAGAKPENGRACAESAREQIRNALSGADMLFITAGMGGGTGTGAAPIIAEVAKDLGILTVGIVSKPFKYEGKKRMRTAEDGIEDLNKHVDSLIVVLNDKLEEILGEDATQEECLKAADDVLYNACSGIAEIIEVEGNINTDFQDIKTVMSEKGQAMMGVGVAAGPNRAQEAVQKAITCPLLEGVNLNGARGVLINIVGSKASLKQKEIRLINETVEEYMGDGTFISGTTHDESLGDQIRVTVIATGLGREPMMVVNNPPEEVQAQATGTNDAQPIHHQQQQQQQSTLNIDKFIIKRQPRQEHHNLGGSLGGYGLGGMRPSQTTTTPRPTASYEPSPVNSDLPSFLRKQAN